MLYSVTDQTRMELRNPVICDLDVLQHDETFSTMGINSVPYVYGNGMDDDHLNHEISLGVEGSDGVA